MIISRLRLDHSRLLLSSAFARFTDKSRQKDDSCNYTLAHELQEAQALFVPAMSKTAVADKFIALQNAAGIKTPLVNPRGSGINSVTLTGWGALAALTSFTSVSLGLAYLVYRRFIVPDPPYAVVSKSGDV